jgi:hypothetical protein
MSIFSYGSIRNIQQKKMSTTGTGFHASSNASAFMGLTTPIHLPILTTNNGSASSHLPGPQLTKAPETHGFTDIPPERQGVDFGQTDYFKYVLNDNECLRKMTLCVKLDALTVGAGGFNARYPDDVLCQAIENITFHYGKDLQRLEGDEIHFRRLQETEEAELARLSQLQGNRMSVADRVTNAESARWYYLEVPFWWTLRDSDNWHQYALQRLTRIIITWRSPSYILQQDGAATLPTPASGGAYILDHFLRFDVVCLSEPTKQEFLKRVKSNGTGGQLYLIGETEKLSQTLNAYPGGVATHVIQLNTFSKYGYNLRFVIRDVANLAANVLNNRRFDCLNITSCYLDISGRRYFFDTDNFYMKYVVNDQLFDGNPELPIFNIPFNVNPDLHSAAVGGFDFSNTTTPQITLVMPAHSSNLQADFMLYVHNYIRLTIVNDQSGAELVQPL